MCVPRCGAGASVRVCWVGEVQYTRYSTVICVGIREVVLKERRVSFS